MTGSDREPIFARVARWGSIRPNLLKSGGRDGGHGLRAFRAFRRAHALAERQFWRISETQPHLRRECSMRLDPLSTAFEAAREAAASGESPIGAAVVCGTEIVAVAGNRVLRDRDPTAHAEMIALRAAARALVFTAVRS
jgi:hypothetical protein